MAVSSLPPWATGVVATVTDHWKAGLAAAWAALALAAPRPGWPWPASGCGACCATAGPLRPGELAPGALLAARALGLHRPVLSEARHLSVPLATGVLRPEVCLPPRALVELGADEQVALCAHELAHLARRDPAWVLLARLVEAVAPFQPLNAWARRRLSDLAECLSDDLAVSASGRPIGLARSLVDVASWTLGERPFLPVAASGALSVRSRLGHRVERLMDPARTVERPRRALLPAAALVVLATALVTPVVSGGATPQAQPQQQPSARAAPRSRAASAASAAARRRGPMPHRRPTREQQIQALSRQIEARAHLHAADMQALEAEIEAVVSKIQPREAEMQAPGPRDREGRAGLRRGGERRPRGRRGPQERAHGRGGTADGGGRGAAPRRHPRDPHPQRRDPRPLGEGARPRLLSRPTDEEMREIRRLSADAARRGAEQARDAMRIAMEALRQAREELRRTGKDLQE